MSQVRRLGAFGFALAMVFLCIGLAAQAGNPATLILQKQVLQINLTKATAGHRLGLNQRYGDRCLRAADENCQTGSQGDLLLQGHEGYLHQWISQKC